MIEKKWIIKSNVRCIAALISCKAFRNKPQTKSIVHNSGGRSITYRRATRQSNAGPAGIRLLILLCYVYRSPPELLQEIVLVDDGSDKPWLKEQLQEYVQLLPKVRLVRQTTRSGLVKARLRGIKVSCRVDAVIKVLKLFSYYQVFARFFREFALLVYCVFNTPII